MLSVKKATRDPQAIAIIHSTTKRDGYRICLDDTMAMNTYTPPILLEENEQLAIEPDNDKDARNVIACGGRSGSGKSHAARNFAIRYHMLWPDRPIYLISALDKDKTLDALDYIERMDVSDFIENPPDVADFDHSLVIVDDIEKLEKRDKKLHAAVQGVIDDIATTGRHKSASMFVCSHLLTDYKRTRLFLGECQAYYIFPNGASMTQLTNLLGTYGGADTKDIVKIRHIPSRWVCMSLKSPPTVLHEHGCYLLRQDDKKNQIVPLVKRVTKRKRDEPEEADDDDS